MFSCVWSTAVQRSVDARKAQCRQNSFRYGNDSYTAPKDLAYHGGESDGLTYCALSMLLDAPLFENFRQMLSV